MELTGVRRSLRNSFLRLASAHAGAAKCLDHCAHAPGACGPKPRDRQGAAGGAGRPVRTADTPAHAVSHARVRAALAPVAARAAREGILAMSFASTTESRRAGRAAPR